MSFSIENSILSEGFSNLNSKNIANMNFQRKGNFYLV